MSVKDPHKNSQNNYRTSYLHYKNKYNKKGKNFYNPRKKSYQEETKMSPINLDTKQEKENDPSEVEIPYEDEYLGLMDQPRNINWDNAYYYIEKEKTEEYNNFKTKWKTEICRYWEMNGKCIYGDSCAFAHGDSELKKRKMTFNYKTKPCKQFFELGYCSYGCRCQFSHKKEDIKKDNENTNENQVSYLKIIKEFLSDDNQISHELIKRPRLMTFEKITSSTLEESEKSKLQLYEDIINIKNDNSSKNVNTNNNNNINNDHLKFKLSEDSNYTNVSSEHNNNDKE